MSRALQAVILAAGKGTRMGSDQPKVLHSLFNRPLLDYPLQIVRRLGVRRPVVVVGWGKEKVLTWLGRKADSVVQSPQRGTAHAVQVTEKKVSRFPGNLLIWPADMTLVREKTLQELISEHQKTQSDVTILSSTVPEPKGYGRIVRRAGHVVDIREEIDANPQEKRICEINTGVYLFRPQPLFQALKKIRPANQKKEYYLTDSARLIAESGGRVQALPLATPAEAQGINSQADLARAFTILNQETIRNLQTEGVTILAPEQTFIAPNVRIGRGTVIYPWTYIEADVRIGSGCEVGPFAKIRSGSVIDDGAVIGSFVEINRSRIGKKVLAKHLSYLGDAVIGDGTNIGAGTITANYDGKKKNQTRIGKKAFVGVDTIFIAPIQMGDGAQTGAGAVLTKGTRVKNGEVFIGVPAKSLAKKGKWQKRSSK